MRVSLGITAALIALMLADVAEAWPRGRRGRGRGSGRRVVKMRMAMLPLPPAWTATTEGMEVAPDAPTEELDATAKGGLKPSRVAHGVSKAACLRELRRLQIPFRVATGKRRKRSIWLPVELTGPVQGVTFKALYWKRPPLVDCQFAIGLHRAAGVLKKHGVTKLLYTSTYRPPPRRRWRRVGHHPQGMAMDVNEIVMKNGTKLVMLKDWEKFYGGPGNCVGRVKTQKGALLRRLTCALEKAHVFKRIISPDSDHPHRNHWHISGASIGEAFVRSRWAGRTLHQPLPGHKGFRRYYRWYTCWKIRSPRRRYRCYRRRARRKPRPPVRYRLPRQTPRVAIWLKSQLLPAKQVQPPATAREVALPEEGREARPAPPPQTKP